MAFEVYLHFAKLLRPYLMAFGLFRLNFQHCMTGAVIAAVKCLKVFIRAGGELNT